MKERSIDRIRIEVHLEMVFGFGWCFTRPSRLRYTENYRRRAEGLRMQLKKMQSVSSKRDVVHYLQGAFAGSPSPHFGAKLFGPRAVVVADAAFPVSRFGGSTDVVLLTWPVW